MLNFPKKIGGFPENYYLYIVKKKNEKKYKLIIQKVMENEHKEPNYKKVFVNGKTELCRGDLESLPCPFNTEFVSDETMQEIVDELENEMTEWREWNRNGDVSDDRLDEVWWENLEKIVVEHKIPYYEDE